MAHRILVGQSHATQIRTKEGKNYLVVGSSAIPNKYHCKSLDSPMDFAMIHHDDIEESKIHAESQPLTRRVM